MPEYEVLREVWKIIQYKDGCIFKTRFIERKWVDMEAAPPEGFQYISVSTSYKGERIRRKT